MKTFILIVVSVILTTKAENDILRPKYNKEVKECMAKQNHSLDSLKIQVQKCISVAFRGSIKWYQENCNKTETPKTYPECFDITPVNVFNDCAKENGQPAMNATYGGIKVLALLCKIARG